LELNVFFLSGRSEPVLSREDDLKDPLSEPADRSRGLNPDPGFDDRGEEGFSPSLTGLPG
jgi:hypothetical protein